MTANRHSEITRTIEADKEGLIEHLREALGRHEHTHLRSPSEAWAAGWNRGLEFAIGVLEDWDGKVPS